MNGFYAIAIDGPSGAGKSTLAKRLASAFNFIYVDTGAIYRTLGLACYRAGIDRKNPAAVMEKLSSIRISIGYNKAGEQRMMLDGEDVSAEIRLPEISLAASDVSAIPEVRAFLLEMQRRFARESHVIMDGRDIGTVVLPQAELKIFLTASPEARALRRMKDLQQKGIEEPYEQVLAEIIQRDEQDSSRAAAPLKQAEDAILVDSSDLSFEETFQLLCEIVISRLAVAQEGQPCES
ncbi:MAG: (d)CMP kinase [Oscillospiraceae bacterium]|nr:(d)CMP kinase [Oscillospiraceae bacterium]